MKLNRLVAVMILVLVMVMATFVVAHAESEIPECPEHEIPMVFVDEKVTKEPTCAATGVSEKHYKCPEDGCKETKSVEVTIAKLTTHGETEIEKIDGDKDNHNIVCKVCGTKFAEAHEFVVDTEKTIAPTCKEAGKVVYKCSKCGFEKVEEVQKLGHKWDEADIIEVVDPTCVDEGYTLVKCQNCGKKVKVQKTKATGEHDWNVTVVEPTCTESGYTYKQCKNCTATEFGETIEALGHDMVEVPEVPATCDKKGKTAYEKCSRCDYVETDGKAIAKLNHKNAETVKEVKSTCTKKGVAEYYKCPDCGKFSLDKTTWVEEKDFKPTELPMAAHNMESKEGKAATCTEDGWKAYTVCKVCGAVEGAEVIKATGHKATTYSKEVKATCKAEGKKAYAICSVCNKYFTVIVDEKDDTKFEFGTEISEKDLKIAKLEHEWTILGAKEPTCEEAGYTGTMYCTLCLSINPDFTPEVIDKLGHIWERKDFDPETAEYEIVEPTCKKDGKKTLTCECGKKLEETIPADTKHKNFYIVEEKVEPTCTEAGYEKRACTECTWKKTVELAALGHKGVKVPEVKPTETEVGYTEGVVCEVCGIVISGHEEIPATGKKEYGKYSITNVKAGSDTATGKVVVDGEPYEKVYARVTIWFNNFDSYITMRAEVIDGEFEVGYGVNGYCGITVVVTTTKNCASVPMSSCNILAAYEG